MDSRGNGARLGLVLSMVPVLLLLGGVASALPASKTEAEMMQIADLVVDAECVQVVCDGKPVEDAQKTITNYLSTLWPSKSYKGGLPNSFQIRGAEWTWKTTPPVGGWHQEPVKKGWAGKLYLEKLSDGTYTKVWWNAMIEDTAKSKPLALPPCAAATDGGVADIGPPPDGKVKDAALQDGPGADDQTTQTDQSGKDADHDLTPAQDGPTGDLAGSDAASLPPATEDDGCSCRAAGSPSGGCPAAPLLLAGLLLAGLLVGRRRAGDRDLRPAHRR